MTYAEPTQPVPFDQPTPPRKPGTNGFAIAAFVLGLIGGILLSVVFGVVALVQTRRSGQAGRGLAIAGLALSGVWALALGIGVVLVLVYGADRGADGAITAQGDVSAYDVRVGDCLNGLKDTTNLSTLPGVPCTEPHEGEVFARFDLPPGAFPGVDKIEQQAEKQCTDRFETYAPSSVDDPKLELFFLRPTEPSWAQGDREVVCVATDPTRRRTGSLKG